MRSSGDRKRLAEEAMRLTDPNFSHLGSLHEEWKRDKRVQAMARPLARALLEAEGELERLRDLLAEVRPHIGDEQQRSWPDDPDFDDMLRRVEEIL